MNRTRGRIDQWIYLGFVVSWSVTWTTVTTATTSTSAASTVVTSSASNWSWLEVNFLDTSSTALLGSFNLDVGCSFLKIEFIKIFQSKSISPFPQLGGHLDCGLISFFEHNILQESRFFLLVQLELVELFLLRQRLLQRLVFLQLVQFEPSNHLQ